MIIEKVSVYIGTTVSDISVQCKSSLASFPGSPCTRTKYPLLLFHTASNGKLGGAWEWGHAFATLDKNVLCRFCQRLTKGPALDQTREYIHSQTVTSYSGECSMASTKCSYDNSRGSDMSWDLRFTKEFTNIMWSFCLFGVLRFCEVRVRLRIMWNLTGAHIKGVVLGYH